MFKLFSTLFFLGACFNVCMAQTEKTGKKNPLSKADSLQKRLGDLGVDAGVSPKLSIDLPGGKGKSESLTSLVGETIPELGLKVKEFKSRRADRKKKKQAAKLAKVEYQGIQMEERSVKYGSGDRANIEIFHVLKQVETPDPYVRLGQTRWYDLKKKILSSSVIKDKESARLLHGPYKKYVAGNLVEEGYYYKGTLDGRWVRYDNKYTLLDKQIWEKGFPAESRITYYDAAQTKVKEVIPVQFGIVEGEYLAFYDGGQLKESGKYEKGKKIGRWFEYYQFRNQRKTETQHAKTCWEDFEPFKVKEWDEKGTLLFDNSKDVRAQGETD
ncbi:hypothetical protein GCM10023091_38100 [Ravibacter arvi]|uniref:MORN repeat protein n=1 Tax=Ravibacter arvi TaxID=2051041 RepID=A0ABP8M7J0_9BACT